MEDPLHHPAASPVPDLVDMLAELDRLAEQTTLLRKRLACLTGAAPPRPGWPIRRIASQMERPTARLPGGGA